VTTLDPLPNSRSPSTFVVGAGPVATALSGALRLGGVPVLGLWARRAAPARTAAAAAGVAAFSSAPPDLMLEADVVIVAVRDDAVAQIASMLVGTGLITRKHVLLHCSGAVAAREAFADVIDRVGGVGTLHPLRAIADGRAAARAMKGTMFGVEGDDRGRSRAIALVQAMGGVPLALDGDHMASYHAAAAMASNYLVALLDAATQILTQAGLSYDDALAALVPLAQGALTNVGEQGIPGALTGPIRRGDRATVTRHLAALQDPELASLYRTLARRALAIAGRIDGPTAPERDLLEAIATLLAGPVGEA
jgi:predicted short-subunit dehydrogenase-like oxidoreductase (DUF2520 family)